MAFTLFCIFSLFNSATADERSMRRTVPLSSSTGQTTPLYQGSYALVVGNGNYKNWGPLRGALQDVKEVAEALTRQGFTVTLKTDMTHDEFMSALNDFVLVSGNSYENRLLLYYAGHGYTETISNDEELGYLVMVDAPADPKKDRVGFSKSSVDMETLVTQAKKIRAKHVLFMFDSCFSGTLLNPRAQLIPQSITDKVRNPVRQFITAGQFKETVPDHSVFKQAFLDLLEGRDNEPYPDGYITGEELGYYLKNKVPYYNPSQHPQFGAIRDPRLDKGDFVFLASGQAVVDKPQPVIGGGGTLVAGGPGPVSKPKPATGPKIGDIWLDPVTGMEFVWVSGGSFDMGSPDGETGRRSNEGPVHPVEVDGFWMGKTEVTVGQFRKFVDAKGKGYQTEAEKEGGAWGMGSDGIWAKQQGYNWRSPGFSQDANHPVVCVSWNDVHKMLEWMSGKGNGRFQLPSEAQWEYACRGGKKTARYWGDSPDMACEYGNVGDQTLKSQISNWSYAIHNCSDGYVYTAPVGKYKSNKFGLYDMLGNVWEWCEDVYIADIYGKSDKKNPIYNSGGPIRVIRGGSWINVPDYVRCALRDYDDPSRRNYNVGFRLLRMP
jgi:formylglycine-generating enzyme required for sulfatase activity